MMHAVVAVLSVAAIGAVAYVLTRPTPKPEPEVAQLPKVVSVTRPTPKPEAKPETPEVPKPEVPKAKLPVAVQPEPKVEPQLNAEPRLNRPLLWHRNLNPKLHRPHRHPTLHRLHRNPNRRSVLRPHF